MHISRKIMVLNPFREFSFFPRIDVRASTYFIPRLSPAMSLIASPQLKLILDRLNWLFCGGCYQRNITLCIQIITYIRFINSGINVGSTQKCGSMINFALFLRLSGSNQFIAGQVRCWIRIPPVGWPRLREDTYISAVVGLATQ